MPFPETGQEHKKGRSSHSEPQDTPPASPLPQLWTSGHMRECNFHPFLPDSDSRHPRTPRPAPGWLDRGARRWGHCRDGFLPGAAAQEGGPGGPSGWSQPARRWRRRRYWLGFAGSLCLASATLGEEAKQLPLARVEPSDHTLPTGPGQRQTALPWGHPSPSWCQWNFLWARDCAKCFYKHALSYLVFTTPLWGTVQFFFLLIFHFFLMQMQHTSPAFMCLCLYMSQAHISSSRWWFTDFWMQKFTWNTHLKCHAKLSP